MEQADAPWALAEAALAHTLGDQAAQSYVRTDLFARRRQLMDDWAAYIAGQPEQLPDFLNQEPRQDSKAL